MWAHVGTAFCSKRASVKTVLDPCWDQCRVVSGAALNPTRPVLGKTAPTLGRCRMEHWPTLPPTLGPCWRHCWASLSPTLRTLKANLGDNASNIAHVESNLVNRTSTSGPAVEALLGHLASNVVGCRPASSLVQVSWPSCCQCGTVAEAGLLD